MHDTEQLELMIFRHIVARGTKRSCVLADFTKPPKSFDANWVVERLKDLKDRKFVTLYKYWGAAELAYGNFYSYDVDYDFFGGEFLVEITGSGQRYLETLEDAAKKEAQSNIIFISCGQCAKAEIGLGRQLAVSIDEITGGEYRGYFAEGQNSADNLSRHIFRAIHDCSGFVAVMHHRGLVDALDEHFHRGSVWVEQEIAIVSFLTQIHDRKLPALCYIQRGIKREGVRQFLFTNANEFENETEVLNDFHQTRLAREIETEAGSR